MLTYNSLETTFLRITISIAVLRTVAATDGPYTSILESMSLALFILPTVIVILACLVQQCCSGKGGYGRLKQFSLGLWWAARRRRGRAQSQLNEAALNNMLVGARDPLLVDQFKD